jgi:hypothetical protein
VYRSWFALSVAGVLGGLALVALSAGFSSPVLLVVAAGCGVGSALSYRYAADRMVRSVYRGVDRPVGDGGTDRREDRAEGAGGRAEGRETTSRSWATDGGATTGEGYDEWDWASRDPDDPFWSADEDDWEDPWAWESTDPEDAGGGWDWDEWRRRRERRRRGERRRRDDGREHGEDDTGGAETDPAEVLGLDPEAAEDPERVREAYRERAKETHPDNGGSVEAFLRVREAYERLAGEE